MITVIDVGMGWVVTVDGVRRGCFGDAITATQFAARWGF